ncbi:hypothetical protein SU69_09025 [Thermosipho melanesiensis]|uniref:Uncharacterized protein n=2 Tax=Thermosipho melanesiensis TaxID=46541 RepID=A6LNX1_THEM4|nr:monovalent cation/H(+) antiporter subunit G [Thermosipho melanesiensis]ABR31622.1 hypothetical protein Tmel_1787 [Thermosipho melanesiensis BI429]APT74651.1 hypothetical protein BW47_09405 [Thermosipho melanesiensis]OOC35150.1 hypothetical protein SU69_09025 [Thermosipho melanesiensis]OOC35360.1 hypothetical protein SU70_09035 [Thermosipho melanesiensis]OOC36611.1 hypothetical protein SU68_09095 [Thermosipho melanesiensis]
MIIILGAILMLVGNICALFSKNIFKKLHYLSAGDTGGAILIFIGLMLNNFQISKLFVALMIFLVGMPAVTYFISISLVRREKRR